MSRFEDCEQKRLSPLRVVIPEREKLEDHCPASYLR